MKHVDNPSDKDVHDPNEPKKKVHESRKKMKNLKKPKVVHASPKKVKKVRPKRNPPTKDVLASVKDLPTHGKIAQDKENGMVYLDLKDDWIFNALTVLKDYGYTRPPFFVYPPFPIGAHIKIVTKREAEDHELFGKMRSKVSDHIGKAVEFKVVSSYAGNIRIRKYGIQAKYKIRVVSDELSKIRKELTGLRRGPNNGHFVIVVGLRIPSLNEEMERWRNGELEKHFSEEFEKQIDPDEKHEF